MKMSCLNILTRISHVSLFAQVIFRHIMEPVCSRLTHRQWWGCVASLNGPSASSGRTRSPTMPRSSKKRAPDWKARPRPGTQSPCPKMRTRHQSPFLFRFVSVGLALSAATSTWKIGSRSDGFWAQDTDHQARTMSCSPICGIRYIFWTSALQDYFF